MKLNPYVKPMTGPVLEFAKLTKAKGFLLLDWIFLRPEIYQDLLMAKPNPQNIGIIIHEETHYKRSKEAGVVKFATRYILSRKGRLEEELAAYGEQMRYLKRQGLDYDLDRVAKNLSSWTYLWCSSYSEAKARLEKIWEQAKNG